MSELELISAGDVAEQGPANARAREQVRRILGLPAVPTPRRLNRGAARLQQIFHADDPVAELEHLRDELDGMERAICVLDAARYKRFGDLAGEHRCRTMLRLLRLTEPKAEAPLAELLDVGAYKGGLIDSITPTHPELDYLAIDLRPKSAPQALSVSPMDATALDLPDNSIGQVYILDVLEHMRSEESALRAVAEAVRVARDLVYIECPHFGDDAYLADHDLKWCWADWDDHTLATDAPMFQRFVDALMLDDVAEVRLGETVYDRRHHQLVRIDAPTNTTIATPWIADWRPHSVEPFDRALNHRVILEVRLNPDAQPLWVSPTQRSHTAPRAATEIPNDAARLAAVMTTRLPVRQHPVTTLEVERANDVVGKLLAQGEPTEWSERDAEPELVAEMLRLFAEAVQGEGNRPLADQLRVCAAAGPTASSPVDHAQPESPAVASDRSLRS